MSALAALALTAVLFGWFVTLEQRDRPLTVVAFLLGLVLADAIVYADQNLAPTGILHPEYEHQSFRLLDVVIPAAIFARLVGRRRRHAPADLLLPWLALLVWLATAGAIGVYEGHPPAIVAFHAKVIVYLGAFALAAGVPLADLLARRRLELFLGWSAAAAAALMAAETAGVRIDASLPLLPLRGFGELGADAATLFTGLGALALALGLFAERDRGRLLGLAALLLATPAVAGQRAAFVALAASLAAIAVGLALTRRRLRVTPTEAGLAGAAVVALALLATVPAAVGGGPFKLPLQDRVTTTFSSYEEVLTTRDRLYQWAEAGPLIARRPLFGWGLGHQYVTYEPGRFVFRVNDAAHNIALDLLLRTGLVGLGLFALALATTGAALLRGWRGHADARAAAFALGTAAAVAGLLGKGMAESIFEKYRLAGALGIGIGAMIAAGLPARAPAPAEARGDVNGGAPAGPASSAARRASAPACSP